MKFVNAIKVLMGSTAITGIEIDQGSQTNIPALTISNQGAGTSGLYLPGFNFNAWRSSGTGRMFMGHITNSALDFQVDSGAVDTAQASFVFLTNGRPTDCAFQIARSDVTPTGDFFRIKTQAGTYPFRIKSDGDVSLTVPNDVYGVGWDGNKNPPTKNDVYNKFQTLGAGPVTHTTRASMAGASPSNNTFANLVEGQRSGLFKYSTTNLATQVTSDPQQGIYVAPTSDTSGVSGAWVRVWDEINGYPEWFGAISGSSADAAGNSTALPACVLVCPVINLRRADYWINTTWKINTPYRTIQGHGGIAYDATQGTRILVTSGTLDAMQVGPDVNPGGNPGSTFLRQVKVRHIQLSRSVTIIPNASVTASSCGLRAKYLYVCEFEHVYAWENSIGFNVGGTVACTFRNCIGFRSAPATTGTNDIAMAWYLDGNFAIGLAGGNASLKMIHCHASISDALLTTPDPNRYGLRAVGSNVDIFIEWFETVGGWAGISLIGTGAAGSDASNTDIHIVHPVIDQPINRAIEIGDLPPGGQINLESPYWGTGATVGYGLVIFDCNGLITVDGINATGTAGVSDTFGIWVNNSSGVHIGEMSKLTNFERPIDFSSCSDFSIKAKVNAKTVAAQQATVLTSCTRGVVETSFKGAATCLGPAILFNGTGNSLIEVNTSGLKDADIVGFNLSDNGTAITAEGTFGTNNRAYGTILTILSTGGAGGGYTFVTRNGTTTETATSGEVVVLCTATTDMIVNLPTAIGNTAKYNIKKTGAGGKVIVDANTTQTIDGGLTATLSLQYESITLVSDNANWNII